jgi:polar amino acid transport system substrate-binding protein
MGRTYLSGGGFVRYSYENPAENFTVKQKLTYVMLVDQDWIIGAGIYDPTEESPILKAGSNPQVREEFRKDPGITLSAPDDR